MPILLNSGLGDEVQGIYKHLISNILRTDTKALQRFKKVSAASGVEIEIFDKAYARNRKFQPELIAICWGNPNTTIEDKEKFWHTYKEMYPCKP